MSPAPANMFWNLIHAYDSAIFPVQYLFSIAAIVLLVLIAKRPSTKLNRLTNLFLMVCYLWIGVVFFLVYNRQLSARLHYFQPILMLIVAALFGLDLLRKKTEFKLPTSIGHRMIFWLLIVHSVIGYPLVGWLLGHPYTVKAFGAFSVWVPILGVFPCPTTVFGLALLGAARPKADKIVMIVLLLWALNSIMGPPVRQYGVYEDYGLFLAGIYGLVMLIKRFRQKS